MQKFVRLGIIDKIFAFDIINKFIGNELFTEKNPILMQLTLNIDIFMVIIIWWVSVFSMFVTKTMGQTKNQSKWIGCCHRWIHLLLHHKRATMIYVQYRHCTFIVHNGSITLVIACQNQINNYHHRGHTKVSHN